MSRAARGLTQDLLLLDLVLAMHRAWMPRLEDEAGRGILAAYVRAEEDRRRRIDRHLGEIGAAPAAALRAAFTRAGRIYGRATSWLGTRAMLRIALSAATRAARRACAAMGDAPTPDLLYLATLRARNEGELVDALRQHLIDTRGA